MSTSLQCPFGWNKLAVSASAFGLVVFTSIFASGRQSQLGKTPDKGGSPSSFLEIFQKNAEPPIITKDVLIESAVGRVRGYLARPGTPDNLPGVLLLPNEAGLTDWMRENARDLASVGYVALAIEPSRRGLHRAVSGLADSVALFDEQTLAQQSAAVRWLRGRADVLPDRVGVVGWSRGGWDALALAASMPLQACVICDGQLSSDSSLVAGLRQTPLLGLFAAKDADMQKRLPSFEKALTQAGIPHKMVVFPNAEAGFMYAPDQRIYAKEAADKAYFQIYEFLGKYVEDASRNRVTAQPAARSSEKQFATIADIMRAVNETRGVRGKLIEALSSQPSNERQWASVRANAAIMAEAGNLLRLRTPRKGSLTHWHEQVKAFTAAANRILEAEGRHDYADASRGLRELAARCASCHEMHR
jgi:carboxymethylenebutenolidase